MFVLLTILSKRNMQNSEKVDFFDNFGLRKRFVPKFNYSKVQRSLKLKRQLLLR